MRVLNLYAGIGGNRKLWEDIEVTAVELNPEIAAIYKDLYPNDIVLVEDAHEYLLNNYQDYDFIWASPPCPSHSGTNHFLNAQGIIRYPDMELYQEILLLKHFFKGKYVIENVKPYYTPLIPAQKCGRHLFWSNFRIPNIKSDKQIGRMNGKQKDLGMIQAKLRQNNLDKLGFDLSKYEYPDKDKLLRNCVVPEIGLTILNCARNIITKQNTEQLDIFDGN